MFEKSIAFFEYLTRFEIEAGYYIRKVGENNEQIRERSHY